MENNPELIDGLPVLPYYDRILDAVTTRDGFGGYALKIINSSGNMTTTTLTKNLATGLTTLVMPHGQPTAPQCVIIQALDFNTAAALRGGFYVAWDATNVTVTLNVASLYADLNFTALFLL